MSRKETLTLRDRLWLAILEREYRDKTEAEVRAVLAFIGFASMVLLSFIMATLKLAGHMASGWAYVTAPMWGGFLVAFVVKVVRAVLRGFE